MVLSYTGKRRLRLLPGVEGGKNESFSGATNGHQLENEANGFFSRNEQCWARREINNPFSFTSHGQVVSSFLGFGSDILPLSSSSVAGILVAFESDRNGQMFIFIFQPCCF